MAKTVKFEIGQVLTDGDVEGEVIGIETFYTLKGVFGELYRRSESWLKPVEKKPLSYEEAWLLVAQIIMRAVVEAGDSSYIREQTEKRIRALCYPVLGGAKLLTKDNKEETREKLNRLIRQARVIQS